MADQKIKAAAGKVPLDLLPLAALKGAARVFGYGGRKYIIGNWHTADDEGICERYVGGALRHLAAAQNPNGTFTMESLAALDKESGLPELDHMICGLLMLRGLLIKHGALPEDPGEGVSPAQPYVDPTAVHVECDCRDCVRMETFGPLKGYKLRPLAEVLRLRLANRKVPPPGLDPVWVIERTYAGYEEKWPTVAGPHAMDSGARPYFDDYYEAVDG